MWLALGAAIFSDVLNNLIFLMLGCLGWMAWMIARALIHARAR